MKAPGWMNGRDCLAIHEMMLAYFGGLNGVRDEGMLESALAKPQNLFAYQSPDLATLAASYASGIIRNHPFLDGNKRTGFQVASVFLEYNGKVLTATEESVVESTLGIAAGQMTEAEYAAWLKKNSRPV